MTNGTAAARRRRHTMPIPPIARSTMSAPRRIPNVPPWTFAVATAVLFAGLHIAAIVASGAGRTPLHNPVGLAVLTWGSGTTVTGQDPAPLLAAYLPYVLAKSVLVCLMTACVAGACRTIAPGRRAAMLAGQLACVTVLAAQLAMLLPWRAGLAWLAAQYLLGVLVDVCLVLDLAGRTKSTPQWSLLAYLSLERTVLVAAFLFGRLVLRERRMRLALATAHAQILATQSLLGETVRGAERMRIARDLHDTIGHHLTALNLHLDLATRQAGAAGTPVASLGTARQIGTSLLAQVRGVVSQARQDQSVDLADAVRVLCAGLPTLQADLRIDEAAARHPAPVAHALFCCIQEAVTNTLRHADASRLTVELTRLGDMTVARIADDGHGRPGLAANCTCRPPGGASCSNCACPGPGCRHDSRRAGGRPDAGAQRHPRPARPDRRYSCRMGSGGWLRCGAQAGRHRGRPPAARRAHARLRRHRITEPVRAGAAADDHADHLRRRRRAVRGDAPGRARLPAEGYFAGTAGRRHPRRGGRRHAVPARADRAHARVVPARTTASACLRADHARNGNPGADGGRAVERGDRRQPGFQRRHGEESRVEYPFQTGRARSRARRSAGDRTGMHLKPLLAALPLLAGATARPVEVPLQVLDADRALARQAFGGSRKLSLQAVAAGVPGAIKTYRYYPSAEGPPLAQANALQIG